jgi:hypothetical protein
MAHRSDAFCSTLGKQRDIPLNGAQGITRSSLEEKEKNPESMEERGSFSRNTLRPREGQGTKD